MTNTIIADNETMMAALKSLKDRGEITLEQYAESLRRNEEIKKVTKVTKLQRQDLIKKVYTTKEFYNKELELEYIGE